ncbi:MAG: c-type cytochrome [Bacteroidia bacterium]|nr:c-type cytochrome [Bacteroidia bacterium]
MAIVMVHFMGLENIRAAWKAFRADPVPPAPVAAPAPGAPAVSYWQAPVFDTVSDEAVTYGRELIANTALYLGPKGKVAAISNGMNCQNCHLDAGTRVFGNNYSAVASTYPKFRARSGMEESIEKRVNDCFERSLNGEALAEDSREMRAIVAYIRWLGTEVPKGEVPPGSGLVELGFLDRAADPEKGKSLYDQKCMSCHGKEGAGQYNAEGTAYAFPPLWGEHSYNTGAGLFRLSRFASYIKANMPLGATHLNPQLSDEEAWDIAAFVNSQDRPGKDIRKDWPDISKKPADHPFGPFSDGFSEKQHRLGPFGPIRQAAQEKKQSRKQGG